MNLKLISESLPYLINGSIITLFVSVLAILHGTICGLLLALILNSSAKYFRHLCNIFINLIKSIPFMVQVFLIYYGISYLGFEIPAFASGVLALSINTAGFQAGIIHSGIKIIPKKQIEAAEALGLSKYNIMSRIILPQVFIKIIPTITNEWVIVLKNSSILSVISVIELTRASQQIIATTYTPIEIYIIVALIYLFMNFCIVNFFRIIEKKAVKYS